MEAYFTFSSVTSLPSQGTITTPLSRPRFLLLPVSFPSAFCVAQLPLSDFCSYCVRFIPIAWLAWTRRSGAASIVEVRSTLLEAAHAHRATPLHPAALACAAGPHAATQRRGEARRGRYRGPVIPPPTWVGPCPVASHAVPWRGQHDQPRAPSAPRVCAA